MKPVITFDRVSKRYRRYASTSLREAFSKTTRRWFRGLTGPPTEEEVLWAVRDLSFEVEPGRTLGIIGPNGAGKTTTLKLLSRITRPTSGRIEVNGRVSALIELGAGFHPELTGRENVFLNGTILGMRRREIEERFDEIVQFAQLEKFIDTPVKYYSSGMYARLGFAVAAHTNPDVLLVDEVLAVGDYSFQQRCYERMRTLKGQGTTILLVSHNLQAISEVCDEVVVLNHGEVAFEGPTLQGISEYSNVVRAAVVSRASVGVGRDGIGERLVTQGARVMDVQLVDDSGLPVQVVAPGDWVRMLATIEFREDAEQPVFSCFVRDEQGRLVYNQTTRWQGLSTPSFVRGQSVTVAFKLQMNVIDGTYHFGLDLVYQDLVCFYDHLDWAVSLVVANGDGAEGVADLRCRFSFQEAPGRDQLILEAVDR